MNDSKGQSSLGVGNCMVYQGLTILVFTESSIQDFEAEFHRKPASKC